MSIHGAGIELLTAEDFATWYLSVQVLGNTVYEVSYSPCPFKCPSQSSTILPIMDLQGEKFALKFRFDNQYPISAPAVQFVVDSKYQAPVHPVRSSTISRY